MEGIQYGIQQGYNPITGAAYPTQQYAGQQGLFGVNPQINPQVNPQFNPLTGLMGSGIPGLFSSNIDPMNAALMPQTQWGQPFGQQPHLPQLAQLAQHVQLAQQLAQQQLGRLPFALDPISAAIVQQRAQVGPQAQFAPWLGVSPLNRIDPVTAAYIQQAQIAQLYQQLALQSQLGQQSQFGHAFGPGYLGQGQFGRTLPWQFGPIGAIGNYGGQPPIC